MVNTQYLIDTNKLLLDGWNKKNPGDIQPIGTRSEISEVIPWVENLKKDSNELDNLIKKASYLMAIVSWLQPFLDGNKRTGIVSAIKFLNDNGYDLDIKKGDEKEIRSLLYDIQDQRTSLDLTVVEKIIIYTTDHIVRHESKR